MSDDSQLSSALDAFEDCLEMPVIPGELPSWIAGVTKTSSDAMATLEAHIQSRHGQLFKDILRENSDLATRVEQLREEDKAVQEQAQEVLKETRLIAGDAPELESQDPTIKQDIEGFVKRSLDWIIQVRKQEAALTAWYQEAFNRDTGVAD
jgi:hypothetical protein